MLAIEIDNPLIENYFKDSVTIEKVLEYIAFNKISIEDENDLTDTLVLALEDIALLVQGKKEEIKARDFLDAL